MPIIGRRSGRRPEPVSPNEVVEVEQKANENATPSVENVQEVKEVEVREFSS